MIIQFMTSARPSNINDISCNLEYPGKNIFIFRLEFFFNTGVVWERRLQKQLL